jgi:pilus assembly protein CpaE
MTSVIVASPVAEFETRLRQVMNGTLNGNLRRWPWMVDSADASRVAQSIADEAPGVVTLGPGVAGDLAVRVAEALDRNWPEIIVVIVAEPTAELWAAAVRAGARDIVSPRAEDSELREAMERALDAARRRSSHAASPPGTAADRRAIMVLSPKGGVGKTTISTNLAVGLGRLAPREVVLVDLDIQFGDVADALRLAPEHSVVDACRVGLALDGTDIKVFLVPHPAGFYALCAPDRPVDADEIADDHVDHVLRTLAGEFRYLVVDTGAGLSGPTLVAMRRATDLVLVGSTDVLSVRAMRKVVETLDVAGMTAQRRHFVLNRADARVGLTPADIEGAVGLSIDIAVPSSRSVPLSTNQGQPLLETGGDGSPAVRPLQELVGRFHDGALAAPGGRRWRRKP